MNAQGSAAVYMVLITPLLLLALGVVAAACLILLQWHRTHELCHLSLFELQQKSGTRFNSLFALNPLARSLRAERAAAEEALEAALALGPEAVVAAEIYLKSVILRQEALRARQEFLKARIYAEGVRDVLKIEENLKREKGVDGWPVFRPLELAVRRTPETSLTPDHDHTADFSQRETVKGTWYLNPANILPAWLARLLPKLNFIRGSCAATLFKKGGLWKPTLGEGRSSWNF